MAIDTKATDWSSVSKSSTDWSGVSMQSTNYTPVSVQSTNWSIGDKSKGNLLLQGGDNVLLESSVNLALE